MPNTFKNWKSSIAYFLNLGIVVAGGVTRPDFWKVAYAWEDSKIFASEYGRLTLVVGDLLEVGESKANAGFSAGIGVSRLSVELEDTVKINYKLMNRETDLGI